VSTTTVEDVAAGGLVGFEQEFIVSTRDLEPVDFRRVLPQLEGLAPPLDPDDPRARRTVSGVVLTADGREAEAAAPPIAVRPGFADDVGAWTRAARHELETRLGDDYTLHGYSTHLSVAADNRRNARASALFARTFAPGLMLLVDRATSPGLIIRPRPGRVELCGEFVDGPWMRAATVYAAGAVRACDNALTGTATFAALPPQVVVATRPARARAGWFVDRTGFGTDILADGARRARLHRCDGRRVRVQDHFEAAWTAARTALHTRAAASDLAAVDDLVSGRAPLPTEIDPEVVAAGDAGRLPAPSPLGDVARVRLRPGFTVEATAATWATTVFCLRARGRVREAYAAIPRARLASFFTALDAGRLDDLLGRYLALPPTDRPVAMAPNEPALGDVPPGAAQVTDAETAERLANQVGGSWRRAEKGRQIEIPAAAGDSIVVVPTRSGCLVSPATRWIAGVTAVVVIVVAALAYLLTRGGGEDHGASPTPSPPSSPSGQRLPECGAGADGFTIDVAALGDPCRYAPSTLSAGLVYKVPRLKSEDVTVDLGPGVGLATFVDTCVIHDGTPAQRAAAKDAKTGFVGPSFFVVVFVGLRPDGRVRIELRAPDAQVRTGDGIGDKNGYAEVDIPINIPAPHTITDATYYPNGDPNSAGIPIPTSSISSGVLNGSFPTTQCVSRDVALARAPKPQVTRDQAGAATEAVTNSFALWAPYHVFGYPGVNPDLSGPYRVAIDDDRFLIGQGGLTIPLDPVKGTDGDKRGKPPTSVNFHTGSVVGPGSTDSGDAWQHAFPCGAGNLALTVCAKNAPALTDSTYGSVAAVFEQPVPLAGSDDVVYTFDLAATQYRLRYDAKAAGIDGWTLTGGDPRARVMIRNNLVMLLAPLDSTANATYQITTAANGKHDKQPATPGPLRGTIPVAAVPGVETAQQFLDKLSAAIANRDGAFLSSRLHPTVIMRYGKTACDTYTSSALTPVQFVVTDVRPPSTYAWTTDGQTTNVPDTNDVVVRLTSGGTTEERTIHLARVDGTWRWFTDCTPS
jgi:hypothetical protein